MNPWQSDILKSWSICGMNHYHVDGEKNLFVSMTKDGRCITMEGKDDKFLWECLAIRARDKK